MRACLFSFICECLHFNVEHDHLTGRCRARLINGTGCSCPAFEHNHDEICIPPDQIESGP